MSGGLAPLALAVSPFLSTFPECLCFAQEEDVTKFLAATTHIGSENSETSMEQYVFKKKTDGINIINLRKTWEKLLLAARAIAAVENPGGPPLQVLFKFFFQPMFSSARAVPSPRGLSSSSPGLSYIITETKLVVPDLGPFKLYKGYSGFLGGASSNHPVPIVL
jgi:hypothetical protein